MRRKIILFFFILIAAGGYTVYHYFFWHPHLPPPRDYSHSNVVRKNELMKLKVDYEDTTILNNVFSVSSENKFSGEYSCKLSDSIEYGSCLSLPISSIKDFKKVKKIEIQSQIFSAEKGEGKWVLEIDDAQGKVLYWQGKPFGASEMWKKYTFKYTIDASAIAATTIKIYPWNVSKKKIFLDDVMITFLSTEDESEKIKVQPFFQVDYEIDNPEYDYEVTDKKGHSGKRSIMLGGKMIYSPQICKIAEEVTEDTLKLVASSVWVYAEKDDAEFSFVLAIVDEGGKQIYWNEKNTRGLHLKKGLWHKINAGFAFSNDDFNKFHPSDNICIYLWNKTSMTLFADDFEIVYGQEKNRTGNNPNVNLQDLNGKEYNYVRNQPPFQQLYLKYDTVSIKDVSLVNQNGKGELLPDDNLICGNFFGDKREEILALKNNRVDIYSYNERSNTFNNIQYTAPGLTIDNKFQLLAADVDGDGSDELIMFSETGNLKAFKINKALQLIFDMSVSSSFTDESTFVTAGDYNGDHRADLFVAGSKSGKYNLFTYLSGHLNLISEGKLEPKFINKNSTFINGKFYADDKADDILVSTSTDGINNCILLHYNNSQKQFQPRKSADDSFMSSLFEFDQILLKGNYDNDTEEEILIMRREPRYEFRLYDTDQKGFYVKGNVEFSGYPGNQNPKFYEFPKFIAGRFFSETRTSLMCILRNCDDQEFHGHHCKKYSNIPYLPNSIRFYSFGN